MNFTHNKISEIIFKEFPDIVFNKHEGLDVAIIGMDSQSNRLIYSVYKTIECIISTQYMTTEDAWDYFGERLAQKEFESGEAPIWCFDVLKK